MKMVIIKFLLFIGVGSVVGGITGYLRSCVDGG